MSLDRDRETEALERRAAGARAELLLLYGRRRVGKSELPDRFTAAHGGFRLQAREEPRTAQLRMFSGALAARSNDRVLALNPFSGGDPFFAYLSGRSSRRPVLALDEFPFLVGADPALPSILQSHWGGRPAGRAGIILQRAKVGGGDFGIAKAGPPFGSVDVHPQIPFSAWSLFGSWFLGFQGGRLFRTCRLAVEISEDRSASVPSRRFIR